MMLQRYRGFRQRGWKPLAALEWVLSPPSESERVQYLIGRNEAARIVRTRLQRATVRIDGHDYYPAAYVHEALDEAEDAG